MFGMKRMCRLRRSMRWLPSLGSTRSRDAPDMHGCAGLVGAPLLVFCVSVIPHAQREQVGRVLVIRFSVTNDRNGWRLCENEWFLIRIQGETWRFGCPDLSKAVTVVK